MECAQPSGRRGRLPVALAAVLLAGGTVAAVVGVAGLAPYRELGNGDPGVLVRYGAPLVRLAVDATAAGCVGFLVAAAFFSGRAGPSGVVTPLGYARLRVAGRWALGWLASVVLLLPFDAADTGGIPLARAGSPRSWPALLSALEGPKAWLAVAVLAGLVAVGCRLALRWTTVVVLTGLAVLALLPPLVTGHASSDAGHDVSTSALLLHVPAATVWVGTLLALAWRSRGWPVPVARRYRRLAGCCWLVLAGSGVVEAYELVPAGAIGTRYGLLLGIKVVLVAAVGAAGRLLRGGTATRPGRLVAVELLVLAGTFGASAGLTHLAPPSLVGRPVSADQTLLGYDLAGPPTLPRLLLDWRFDPVFLALVGALVAGYLLGLRRLRSRRRGAPWPARRTAAWLAGCAVLLLATCSGIARYAAAMFSAQLAAHMLIGMLVPVLLALGAPVTLAAAVLPATGPVRYGLRAFRDSVGLRWATHPAVAATAFAAAPFLLYFTDLVDRAARFHWAHVGLDLAFLALGWLFAWVAVGPDPLPRDVPPLARLGMLLAVMPFDVLFGALVVSSRRILGDGAAGANMYSALDLPWVPDLAADQRRAGAFALVLGELALLLALVAVVAAWRRSEHRDGTGHADPGDAAGYGSGYGSGYQELVTALRSAGRGVPVVPGETAQPQAVGHHQQRGQRHRGAGDQRVEQPGGGDR